jgi:radical SAM superfamily enzyme YgiQ (UPF0313 family)
MFRRLVLIALDWTRPKDPPLSLGHASILANILQHKLDVRPRSWAVNHTHFNPDEVTHFIMSHNHPDVDVALGAFVWNEHAIQKILIDLDRFKFMGRIILGGPQISYVKTGLEKLYPQANIFMRGYAETALTKLMQSYSPNTIIKGLHYAGEHDLGLSATAILEELPSPYLNGSLLPQPFLRWETQRGCKFRCSFCQHREPDKTQTSRHFAPDRIKQEAQWIKDNPIIQDLAVLDPIFNSGPNYLEIMRNLRGYTGKLALQSRIEMVTPEFLEELVIFNKTGHVVLEFGLQTIHREEQRLIERLNNMRKVERILQEVQDLKIESEISLIFGLPGQTLESFKSSVQFCVDRGIRTIHAFPLMLLRGTPLHDKKIDYGLQESNEIASLEIPRVQNEIPHVVSSKTFSYSDWRKMAEIAAKLETEYNPKK